MDKKTIKTEEGSALVLVMMVLLVLSVLGAALGVATLGSLNLSENNQDINSAYYIAQAGANMAYEELKVEVDKAYHNNKNSDSHGSFFNQIEDSKIIKGEIIDGKLQPRTYGREQFESLSNKDGSAVVKIEKIGKSSDATFDYLIQSTGDVEGKTSTVEKPVKIEFQSHVVGEGEEKIWTPNVALTFKENVFVDNLGPLGWLKSQINIYGNTVYDSSTSNPFPGPGIINNREWVRKGFLDWGWNYYNIDQKSLNWQKYDTIIKRFPENIPQYPSEYKHWKLLGLDYYRIDKNTYIKEIDTSILGNVTIDTKGETINLVVDNLTLSGAKKFELIGNGTVNLYVKNKLRFSEFSNLENRNGQLNIYHEHKDNPVEIYGYAKINGSLFVKSANIVVAGLTEITNGIISGGNNIRIAGGNEIGGMVYAPNANVQFEGGTEINGVVLAKKLYVWGLATINYEGEYIDDFYYHTDTATIEPTIDDLISSEPALEQ